MYQQNKYTPDDIRKMQRDAIKRVENIRMQAKESINKSFKTPSSYASNSKNSSFKDHNEDEHNGSHYKDCKTKTQNSITNIINSLFKDEDKAIIITLIFLLIKDSDDPTIIFALIYILM